MKNNNSFSFWSYLKKYKISVFFYIFLSLVASACSIAITIIASDAVVYISDEVKQYTMGIISLAIVIGLAVVQRACWHITYILYYKTTAKIALDLNTDLAKRAFKFTSKTYADHNTGTFVQRIVEDPQKTIERLSEIVDSSTNLISAIAMFVYISTLNVWLSLLLVGIMILNTTIEVIRVRIRRKNRAKLSRKQDKAHALTTEIVRSEKDIKSMGLEEKLNEETHACYEDYRSFEAKQELQDSSFFSLRGVLIDLGTWITLILGIVFIEKGLISLAVYMIIYSNRFSMFEVVWGLGNIGNMVAEIRIATSRMKELFDEYEFCTERFGNVEMPPQTGGAKIEFRNVGYTYTEYEYGKYNKSDGRRERKIVSENKVFENLSFEIEENTTVAFVGRSGSGKTTILNLMSKMYEADGGEVLINDININDLTKQSLRSTISLVNQFPYIFDMTIKQNLLLVKGDATDQEINKALKDANLEEFVSSLPRGIDTKVGESGIKLSGGQRQRLAIARAMLRKSNITIFDESTSSLDNFSQEEIRKSIEAMKGKSTIIIVAHRLSTIKDVDRIYFLDDGKIVDTGTFDELFNRNEKFKTMFLIENIENK